LTATRSSSKTTPDRSDRACTHAGDLLSQAAAARHSRSSPAQEVVSLPAPDRSPPQDGGSRLMPPFGRLARLGSDRRPLACQARRRSADPLMCGQRRPREFWGTTRRTSQHPRPQLGRPESP
jgi:hypothetical protein